MSVYQDVGVSVQNRSVRRSRIVSNRNSNRYENSSMASDDNQFLRGYNASPHQNNSFAHPANNSAYKTINTSRMKERHNLSPEAQAKRSLIEELEEKNDMLKQEVDRVEKILNMGDRRKIKKLPEIDGEVMKKELQNAYKQIKFYEVEIQQRQKFYEHEGTYVDKIRRTERILAERKELAKKLQVQMSEIKKQSNEFVKLLQDGHIKKEYANQTSRLHKEIKVFEKKLKEEEDLQQSSYYTSQQKNQRIFQMEQKLMNDGFSKMQMFDMRKKFQKGKEKPKSTIDREQTQDISEDRSLKVFQGLKGQMLTFRKMQKDYAKKIQKLEEQKSDAESKCLQTQIRLEMIERQLKYCEETFLEYKKNIDPNKLKPLIKNSSFTDSSVTQFGKGKGNPLEHRFDVVEAGQHRKKSSVVNDRLIIGKKSAKIVELTLYENRVQFLGFQATYLIEQTLRKGSKNLLHRQNQRFLKEKTVKLESGDFFRQIQCTMNQQNLIIGVIVVSQEGKTVKAGVFEGFSKQLQIKNRQYPCCLYGSYSNEGYEMLGMEKVEPAD